MSSLATLVRVRSKNALPAARTAASSDDRFFVFEGPIPAVSMMPLSSYRTPTRKLRELFLKSRPALIGLECAVVFEDPTGSTLLQDVPTFSKYFAIPLDLCGAHPAQIDPRWRC
ncbi:hypothetical protein AGR2A_Lc90035 [Agrobacterium genomosp. 2 str. CFBP 5494]|uniref:Uncharacterized protein n=1 Tax=Agrobacterium genomosp. 2 str. CFBP 5494 TaxID=1183436 RepID=A0A9W5B5U3_9HYPH|nr:hypothetical protein AGR2A_Lc90035 [Agrobacterium genomosp. 2 str. CFBP 5494]